MHFEQMHEVDFLAGKGFGNQAVTNFRKLTHKIRFSTHVLLSCSSSVKMPSNSFDDFLGKSLVSSFDVIHKNICYFTFVEECFCKRHGAVQYSVTFCIQFFDHNSASTEVCSKRLFPLRFGVVAREPIIGSWRSNTFWKEQIKGIPKTW